MKRPPEVEALLARLGYRNAAREVEDGTGWWSYCPVSTGNGDGPVFCGQPMFVTRLDDGGGRYEPICGHSVEEVSAAVADNLSTRANGNAPVPPSDNGATVQRSREGLFDACRDLAHEERILDRLRALLPEIGLVGEDNNALLVSLAVTSRLLDNPVSVAVKGPSSGGKSWTVDRVLQFFPDEAFSSSYVTMWGASPGPRHSSVSKRL